MQRKKYAEAGRTENFCISAEKHENVFREYDRGRSGHKLIIEYRRIKQRYLHYLCLYALFTINKGAHFVFGFTQIVCDTDVDDFLEGF